MQKTSYIVCPIDECRARLSNVGIGYVHLGDDVYKFNAVQKQDDAFSFYATVTLRVSGSEGTDVAVELLPENGAVEPANAQETYEKFFARFFRLMSQPAIDPFAEYGGNNGNSSYATGGATKHCVRCGAIIDERAVICPKCGCSQKRDYMVEKTSLVGIAAIIFSILGGWLGIALALVGLLFYYKGDTAEDKKGRKNCKIAVGIFVAWIAIFAILFIIGVSTALAGGM